jgi:TP901 family phage tail tape measure protein
MSNKTLTLSIELILKGMSDFASGINAATERVGDFAGGVSAATQPIADMAKNLALLEGAILSAAVAMGVMAVNEAGKFSDSLKESNTLLNLNAKEFDTLNQAVQDYASKSGAKLEDITAALYQNISGSSQFKDSILEAARSTGDFSAALGALSQQEKLSVGGNATLVSSTELLNSTLNAYGATLSDSTRFSDALFTAVKNGVTTIPELSATLGGVTSTASAAGVSIETLLSGLSALTVGGVNTSESVTQLKALLSELLKPSDALKESLGGVSLTSNGLEAVLKQLDVAAGDNIEQFRSLFGSQEAYNAALILSRDSSGAFAQTLTDMSNNMGATNAAFNEMAGNASVATQSLENNFRLLNIAIGENFLAATNQAKGGLSEFLNSARYSVEGGVFDQLFNYVNQNLTALDKAFRDTAQNLPAALDMIDFSGFIAALDNLKAAFGNAFSIDVSTTDGLARAIQTVINAIAGLTEFVAGMVRTFAPMIEILATVAGGFAALPAPIQQFIGVVAGMAIVTNTAAGYIEGIVGAIGGLATAASALAPILIAIAPALAVIGAGFAGWQIGKWATENIPFIRDMQTALSGLIESIFGATDAMAATAEGEQLAYQIENLKQKTGDASITVDNYRQKLREYLITEKEAADAAASTAAALNESADAADESAKKIDSMDASFSNAADSAKKMMEEISAATTPVNQLAAALGEVDKNKLIEAKVTVNTAEIRAQTEIVQALANSLGETVKAAAGATGTIFQSIASMSQAYAEREKAQLEAAAKGIFRSSTSDPIATAMSAAFSIANREMAIQEKAVNAQVLLTEAQIKNMDARTARLSSNDALIRVDGTGMETHVRAFMDAMIREIKIYANEEGSQYLLGTELL